MSAVSLAKTLHDLLGAAATVTSGAEKGIALVSPALTMIAGFFPGAATVLGAIQLAAPYIATVARYAPAVRELIEKGAPVFEAMDKVSPQVLPAVKTIFAQLTNGDPIARKLGKPLTADDVTDEQAMAFAAPLIMGRPWTKAEQERWWDAQNARN